MSEQPIVITSATTHDELVREFEERYLLLLRRAELGRRVEAPDLIAIVAKITCDDEEWKIKVITRPAIGIGGRVRDTTETRRRLKSMLRLRNQCKTDKEAAEAYRQWRGLKNKADEPTIKTLCNMLSAYRQGDTTYFSGPIRYFGLNVQHAATDGLRRAMAHRHERFRTLAESAQRRWSQSP